jgi:hypothetical protein
MVPVYVAAGVKVSDVPLAFSPAVRVPPVPEAVCAVPMAITTDPEPPAPMVVTIW